jgi:hypothetical protein
MSDLPDTALPSHPTARPSLPDPEPSPEPVNEDAEPTDG